MALPAKALGGRRPLGVLLVEVQQNILIRLYLGLDRVADVEPVLFRAQKEDADKQQAHDDARCSQGEQEFAPLPVDQGHAHQGHQKIETREQYISPMRVQIRQAALQQDVGVVPNNRVDSRRRVAEKDDAGQQERKNIFTLQQRIFQRPARCRGTLAGERGLLHLLEFDPRLLAGSRSKQCIESLFLASAPEEPAG